MKNPLVAGLAGLLVGGLGVSSTAVAGPPVCTNVVDGDLGSAVGPNLVPGASTVGANNDYGSTSVPPFTSGCGTFNSPDLTYLWTAPNTADYVIDTIGSSFDTGLVIRDPADCAATEIACNDDGPGLSFRSTLTLSLNAGDQILINVDGFGSSTSGTVVLNITEFLCPDADGDGVCDADDVCLGDDATGDSDADGTCDDLDLCVGDDATGDSDRDGTCNDTDLCFGDDASGDVDLNGVCDGALLADCAIFVEGDLGSAVGAGVVSINTCGSFNDYGDSAGLPTACGSGNGEEQTFLWTAPNSREYIFDTEGSLGDTALSLRDPSDCAATELACDDDGGTGLLSRASITLNAGDTILVAVDYFSGCNDVLLNITEVPCLDDDADGVCNDVDVCLGDDATGDTDADGVCDDLDLCTGDDATGDTDGDGLCDDSDILPGCAIVIDGDLGSAVGADLAPGASNTGAGNDYGDGTGFDYSCNSSLSAQDVAYYWTAPNTAEYVIDTFGSSFDTVLNVRSAADCAATELACNDDAVGLQSAVTLSLNAGDELVIVVDAFGTSNGSVVLNITENLCPDSDGDGVCDDVDFCAGDDATGDTDADGVCDDSDACVGDDTTGDADLDGLCNDTDLDCSNVTEDLGSATGFYVATGTTVGAANVFGGTCGGGQVGGDAPFYWTAPDAGIYVFTTILSDYDTALTLRAADVGDCGTTELVCNDDAVGTPQPTLKSSIVADLGAGEQVIVNVGGFSTEEGAYALHIFDTSTPTQAVNPLVAGAASNFFAYGVVPESRVFILGSFDGPGAGPCLGGGVVCAGLANPFPIRITTGAQAGVQVESIPVPAGAAGQTVWIQTVWFDSATGTGAASNVQRRVVGAAAP